jgi:hypothetical protein
MDTRRLTAVLLACALAAGVAACGSGSGSGVAPTASSTSSGGTVTPSIGPTASEPPTNPPPSVDPTVPPRIASPRPGKSGATGEVTISGHVTDGVEAGCKVLRTAAGATYSLLMTPEASRKVAVAGGAVILRGQPRPGLVTTCQQGTPFEVIEVVPA